MARVLLLSDSKLDLALMKISAYHKALGNQVGLGISDPDMVYISCLFDWNAPRMRGLAKLYPNAAVQIGGSGTLDYKTVLPWNIERLKPDYDLYKGQWFSLGFTTRGCIRRCPFCIVPAKEGKHYHEGWMHPSLWHDHRFGTIQLLDNNWLADLDWFMETSAWIRDKKLKVIEHGMDLRLMTPEIAVRLMELRWHREMKFAFDNLYNRSAVQDGLAVLREAGVNLRRNVVVYVYLDGPDNLDSAITRCQLLKGWGVSAMVMRNRKATATRGMMDLAHWANRHALYWTMDFEDYHGQGKQYRKPKRQVDKMPGQSTLDGNE